MSALTSQTPSLSLDRHHQLEDIHRTESASAAGGVDVRVLQSSLETPSMHPPSASHSSASATSSSMGTTLEQIAKKGGQCQLNSSDLQQVPILYPTQSLPVGSTEPFNFPDPPSQPPQQSAVSAFPSSDENSSGITTVVIPQPPDSLMQMSQPHSMPSAILESSVVSSSPSISLHHHTHHPQASGQEALRSQLESLATEQFITQQLPIELASKFGTGAEGETEDGRTIDVVEQGSMSFQHIS